MSHKCKLVVDGACPMRWRACLARWQRMSGSMSAYTRRAVRVPSVCRPCDPEAWPYGMFCCVPVHIGCLSGADWMLMAKCDLMLMAKCDLMLIGCNGPIHAHLLTWA